MEIGIVLQFFCVQQHQIGPHTRLNQTAVGKADAGGRQRGHVLHGSLQRQHAPIAAVVCQIADKGTVVSGMGLAGSVQPLGLAVRTGHDKGLSHNVLDILFAHAEADLGGGKGLERRSDRGR